MERRKGQISSQDYGFERADRRSIFYELALKGHVHPNPFNRFEIYLLTKPNNPMTEKEKVECPDCNGDGWTSGSEAGHGCDGTDEDCQRSCPVQIQIQVGCETCNGTGELLPNF